MRKHNIISEEGSIVGGILAIISVVTIIGAVAGLVLNEEPLTSDSEASVSNSQVRLQQIDSSDSDCSQQVTKIGSDGKSVNVCGRVCFGQNYRSGGQDNGKLYLTDAGGNRLHDGNTSFTFSVAGIDFPAPCPYVDRNKGIGELQNGQATKSNVFSIPLTFDQPLTDDFCPDVYVNYRGRVASGTPFAKISLRDAGVCKPRPTERPSQPSPRVTRAPSPSSAPPSGDAIEGTITVYSCEKPAYPSLVFCNDGDTCEDTGGLPYNTSDDTTPVENGIWLDDTNEDNTWVYKYKYSQLNGKPLTQGSSYSFTGATAFFGEGAQNRYWSEREKRDDLTLKPGDTQDYVINADRTCSCPFKATTYVRDGATGELITDFDNNTSTFGTSNAKQIVDRGDKPVENQPFTGGQLSVDVPDLGFFNTGDSFGHDALTSIKLYADDWTIAKQSCESTGDKDACPTYTQSYERDGSSMSKPEIIDNIRVACGVDVEYGWYVLSPTPTTRPVPQIGNVEARMFTWMNKEDEHPRTCSYDELTATAGRNSIYKYLGDCDLEVVNESGDIVQSVNYDEYKAGERPGCQRHVFEDLPVGKYVIKIGDKPSTFRNRCADERSFEVKAGETTQVPVVMAFDIDRCDPRFMTESTCDNCRSKGGKCLPRYREGSNERVCCVGQPEDDGPGGCWPPNELQCTGDISHLQASIPNNGHGDAGCREKGLGSFAGWCDNVNYTNACCKVNSSSGGSDDPGQGGVTPPPANQEPPVLPPGTSPDLGYCSPNLHNTFGREGAGNFVPFETDDKDTVCKGFSEIVNPRVERAKKGPEGRQQGTGYCCRIDRNNNEPAPDPEPSKTPKKRWYFAEFDVEGKENNRNKLTPQFCEPGRKNCISLDTIEIKEKLFRRDYQDIAERLLVPDKEYTASCVYTSFNRIDSTRRCTCNEKPVKPGEKPKFTITQGIGGSIEGDVTCERSFAADTPAESSSESVDPANLDLDGNGIVNTIDVLLLSDAYGLDAASVTQEGFAAGLSPDVNGDGIINAIDLSYMIDAFGTSLDSEE